MRPMTRDPAAPFRGLSAYPLTPLRDDVLDVEALRTVVRRLVPAGAGSPGAGAGSSAGPSSDASGGLAGHAAGPVVDSIGALGSTGSYAYLDREEWTTALRTILAEAGTTPVVAGIGALRTREAVARARTAEQLGAAGLLLAPVSYQPLRDSEVLGLFTAVAEAVDLPICIYDNPGTTGFRFSLDLYARLARIPGVAAVKIPPTDGTDAPPAQRLARIRESVGEGFAIGISGDAAAAAHLAAGADAWHSVVAGLFPHAARRLVDAAGTGAEGTGTALSDAVPADTGQSDAVPADTVQSGTAPPDELEVLRPLLAAHGSVRVMAAAAAELGLVAADCLPHPLLPLDGADREAVVAAVRSLAAR